MTAKKMLSLRSNRSIRADLGTQLSTRCKRSFTGELPRVWYLVSRLLGRGSFLLFSESQFWSKILVSKISLSVRIFINVFVIIASRIGQIRPPPSFIICFIAILDISSKKMVGKFHKRFRTLTPPHHVLKNVSFDAFPSTWYESGTI